MKSSKKLEVKVKELIGLDGTIKLKKTIPVIIKTYIGYNYNSEEHKYIDSVTNILEVMRYGKRGTVFVSDGFNMFRPYELEEIDCEKILNEL